MDMTTLSADQLRRAASIKEQIDALTAELTSIVSGTSRRVRNSGLSTQDSGLGNVTGRRPMSAAGKARIAAAARLRWAKYNAAKRKTAKPGAVAASGTVNSGLKTQNSILPKRKFSAAARARIAAAAKARWAKAKAAGKSHL